MSNTLQIPEDIQKKFPEYIELIVGSESMNDEERQYWVNILPIMTPEQLQNLRNILVNEKKQLEQIDTKYADQVTDEQKRESIEQTAQHIKARRVDRTEKEQEHEQVEEAETEALLQQINNL